MNKQQRIRQRLYREFKIRKLRVDQELYKRMYYILRDLVYEFSEELDKLTKKYKLLQLLYLNYVNNGLDDFVETYIINQIKTLEV